MKFDKEMTIIILVSLILAIGVSSGLYYLLYKMITWYSIQGLFMFLSGVSLFPLTYGFFRYKQGKKDKCDYDIIKGIDTMTESGMLLVVSALMIFLTPYILTVF